uniref:NAD(P)/FAD-dependent oxidoreductase n=2 Tax=Candidatus Planktophila sp. TaxID=2175601 RepID=UPI00404A9334
MQNTRQKPRVVILGAGFGGLTAAKKLADFASVTVVDRHNFQTFLPLLYQVSTAGLAADHVAHPIRGALRKTDVQFQMGSPVSIDHDKKTLTLDNKQVLDFDYLVVALGSANTDFGIPGVIEHALGMKSVHEATTIRAKVMRSFEELCSNQDDSVFSISVIGGGPTGVEMAGAFAELVRGPLKNDQARAAERIQINLIEAGPRVLPMFSNKLSEHAKADLEKLDVKVYTNTAVKEIKADSIATQDGKTLESEITIWAAGVRGEPTAEALRLPIIKSRIDTTPTLQVNHYPNIWAIGDIAGLTDAKGNLLPMVAPVALQQGAWAAKQILNLSNGRPTQDFKYRDKGSMATIGRHKAVVEVKNLKLTGVPAWFIWIFLHLFYLLGGRNKVGTIADWTWNYLTFDRGNRHIMDIA